MKIILIYVNGGNKKILRVYTIHYTTIATIVYYNYNIRIYYTYMLKIVVIFKTLKHLYLYDGLAHYIYYYKKCYYY